MLSSLLQQFTGARMEDSNDKAFLLPLADEHDESDDGSETVYEQPRLLRHRLPYLLLAILLLSGVTNIFEAVWIVDGVVQVNRLGKGITDNGVVGASSSYHASLQTVDQPLYSKELYEYTLSSKATDELIGSFSPDDGVVALPKGQPHVLSSKRFPWDPSKEVYVLSSYHSLHSLKLLWNELHKLSNNTPLTSHVLHSLNMLWEDTICAASTTPMTISEKLVANRTAIEEAGQTRQCRDWNELEEFREKNSACFKGMGAARKQNHMIEEWQSCPEGSPYQKVIDNYNAAQKKARSP